MKWNILSKKIALTMNGFSVMASTAVSKTANQSSNLWTCAKYRWVLIDNAAHLSNNETFVLTYEAFLWWIRLMVRTPVCHTGNRSSILLFTAIWLISLVVKQELCNLLSEVRFFDKPPFICFCSSVGRAKDWKSLSQWFNSIRKHQ